MTLREYITENMEHFVNSICNLSSCDCCALGTQKECVMDIRCGVQLDKELSAELEVYLRR